MAETARALFDELHNQLSRVDYTPLTDEHPDMVRLGIGRAVLLQGEYDQEPVPTTVYLKAAPALTGIQYPPSVHTTFIRNGQPVPKSGETYLPRMVTVGPGERIPGEDILIASMQPEASRLTTVDLAEALGTRIGRREISIIPEDRAAQAKPQLSANAGELALLLDFANHPGNHMAVGATRPLNGHYDATGFFLKQAPITA